MSNCGVNASFILTMWYVNWGAYTVVETIKRTFYINYVICKLLIVIVRFLSSDSFYINYVICKWAEGG